MIHRLFLLISIVCCALVAVSFLLFARDQLAGASKHQTTEIVAGQQATADPVPVHKATQQPRRFIDDAASKLISPFTVVDSTSPWVKKGVPTILALLVYGVGLGFVARYTRGMA